MFKTAIPLIGAVHAVCTQITLQTKYGLKGYYGKAIQIAIIALVFVIMSTLFLVVQIYWHIFPRKCKEICSPGLSYMLLQVTFHVSEMCLDKV